MHTDTFVVDPAATPRQTCRLVDRWSTNNGPRSWSGMEACAGLEVGSSELLVRSCGEVGDVGEVGNLHAKFEQWAGFTQADAGRGGVEASRWAAGERAG